MRIGQIGEGRVPGPIRGSAVRRAVHSQEARGRNLCLDDTRRRGNPGKMGKATKKLLYLKQRRRGRGAEKQKNRRNNLLDTCKEGQRDTGNHYTRKHGPAPI